MCSEVREGTTQLWSRPCGFVRPLCEADGSNHASSNYSVRSVASVSVYLSSLPAELILITILDGHKYLCKGNFSVACLPPNLADKRSTRKARGARTWPRRLDALGRPPE